MSDRFTNYDPIKGPIFAKQKVKVHSIGEIVALDYEKGTLCVRFPGPSCGDEPFDIEIPSCLLVSEQSQPDEHPKLVEG